VAVAVALAAAAAFTPVVRDRTAAARVAVAVQRARIAADDPRSFTTRLSAPRTGISYLAARLLPSDRPVVTAASLLRVAPLVGGDANARARGVALYVSGDFSKAASAFAEIRQRYAADWNDLAASELAAAAGDDRERRLIAALAATDRALEQKPAMTEASFNRAMVMEELGASPLATRLWQSYSRNEREPPWRLIARRRIASRRPADTEVWRTTLAALPMLSEAEVADVTATYPEQARRYAEGWFLFQWANAFEAGDHAEAARNLGTSRFIAQTIQHRTGESLAAEAVAVIDLAKGAAAHRLAAAHAAYGRGRAAYAKGDLLTAGTELRRATEAFQVAGSPMAALSNFFEISVAFDKDHPADALQSLTRLLDRERPNANRHRALVAQIEYQIALAEAVLGHWSASLQAANNALNSFTALDERANAGAAEAVVSEDYDFLGQPDLARRRGFAAFRTACAAGDYARARTIAQALCRTEMRGRRWAEANALVKLENDFVPVAPDARFDADMFMRWAIIHTRLNESAGARETIERARSAAAHVTDDTARTRLLADIDGAAAAMARAFRPADAIRLSTRSIDYQRRSSRPIVLPELFLERGRAYAAMFDSERAARDFENGISELERQRVHVPNAFLRTGIFDDASELFSEAITLQIAGHADTQTVLDLVERGRARTLLEQIGSPIRVGAATHVKIEEIQRALAPDTAVIEVATLSEQTALILVTRRKVILTTAKAGRRQIELLVSRLLSFSDSDRAAERAALFDLLIRPLEEHLQDISALNVIGDDTLQRVPFAALIDPRSHRWLVERFTIASAPSAAVFLSLNEQNALRPGRAPKTIALFGDPAIPRDEFPQLQVLASAGREAKQIAHLYPRAEVFIGDQATAERFKTVAPIRNVVHFGGHAIVQRVEPEKSALVLASTSSERGSLEVRDIAVMRFRATSVVVLAACSTMAGRNAAAEGVPSIARAFVVAGVPAVIGTLWDIEDTKATPLMLTLHEQLAAGTSPARALQIAQIRAIRDGRNIRDWSAFALTGIASSR
jgi:CHAT domain-containing protein